MLEATMDKKETTGINFDFNWADWPKHSVDHQPQTEPKWSAPWFKPRADIHVDSVEITELKTTFYQSDFARETVCILEDKDGNVGVGIARASKQDLLNRAVTQEKGMNIAQGRAIKALAEKCALVKSNYLRAVYVKKVNK